MEGVPAQRDLGRCYAYTPGRDSQIPRGPETRGRALTRGMSQSSGHYCKEAEDCQEEVARPSGACSLLGRAGCGDLITLGDKLATGLSSHTWSPAPTVFSLQLTGGGVHMDTFLLLSKEGAGRLPFQRGQGCCKTATEQRDSLPEQEGPRTGKSPAHLKHL